MQTLRNHLSEILPSFAERKDGSYRRLRSMVNSAQIYCRNISMARNSIEEAERQMPIMVDITQWCDAPISDSNSMAAELQVLLNDMVLISKRLESIAQLYEYARVNRDPIHFVPLVGKSTILNHNCPQPSNHSCGCQTAVPNGNSNCPEALANDEDL